MFLEDVGRILDFAAACAGKVAAEERFQHQDERVAFASGKFLLQDVAGNRPHLRYGYRQSSFLQILLVASSLLAVRNLKFQIYNFKFETQASALLCVLRGELLVFDF